MNSSALSQITLPESPKILMILMGSLGDVARGIFLLPPIKSRYPGARVTWVVEPKCEPFVRLHPLIDEVIVFERGGGASSIAKIFGQLKDVKAVVSLDLQRHFKSGLFARVAGARYRVGFHRKDSKEFNWAFNNLHIAPEPQDLPKLSHYLKFLNILGIERVDQLRSGLEELDLSKFWPERVESNLKNYVVVVLGSSWHSKDWLASGYHDLIRELLSRQGRTVILVGDNNHQTVALSLMQQLRSERIIDLTGKTTLPQLVAIMRGCSFMVGPDSGPAHIAGALGVPHITLFGPTSPARTAPLGSLKLVVQSPVGCSPCYKKRCPGLNKICMRLISAQQVLAKAEGL
ncbi:MAG: hypothetical protein DCC75_12430 [Proteobacteria bacterium]|nr:MAG: hypothetical protein DCC75_12430 [Pseudomonadota bacterium]